MQGSFGFTERNRNPSLEGSLGPSWYGRLKGVFDTQAMRNVSKVIRTDEAMGITVYPAKADRLRAYRITPYEETKVVILGQDPYPSGDQADGLSFSCKKFVSPSLSVILDRLGVAYDPSKPFGLEAWSKQGVLLLNTSLSVRQGKPGSHSNIGWDALISATIRELNKKPKLAWMLWGKRAKAYFGQINRSHLIVTDIHPQAANYNPGLVFDGGFDIVSAYTGIDFGIEQNLT